jgi:nucleoside-diphosphate-sugar epimerase
MRRRILVTGGGGFLGRALALRLRRRGLQVRLMDLPGSLPAADGGGLEWHSGDVCCAADVHAALQGCDGVAHLAGLLTPACSADPVRGAAVNLIGTLQVFEAARAQGLDRVVYASTAGVYGPEGGMPQPVTHYGAFKLAAEGAARASWREHGLASVGLRPFVVYGPGRLHGASAGPSLACRAAAHAEPWTIGYTGAAGLVYVDDVACAFVHALLDAPLTGAQVFNLVGAVHGVDEVIAEIRRQVPGARITADGAPLGIAVDVGEDGLDAWFPDRPRTSLAAGIAATLAHYRNPSPTA